VSTVALLLGFVCLLFAPARADETKKPKGAALPAALSKPVPESLADLRAIQKQVKAVLAKVVPCTVAVSIGPASGSGVILKDGYVLTAGHVSGKPGRTCTLILSDGRKIKGKTLGRNVGIDSGLIKITDKGKFPFVEMGDSSKLKRGQWCLSTGHPGGYKKGRSPVVRVGRVLFKNEKIIRTDCTLVGGDSGGPLFDMEGKVIGIHSRIGVRISDNIHVPAEAYRTDWDRLAKGDSWGGIRDLFRRGAAYLGVKADREGSNCKVTEVVEDTPAAKAGFKEGDVIVKFDGKRVGTFSDLQDLLGQKKPDDEVAIEVRRGEETVKLKVKLGRRRPD
jgi:serine protease Do